MLLVGALSLTSCNLDFKPISELTENGFWDTEAGVRSAHVGLMSGFRNYTMTFISMGETRADLWGGKTVETPNDDALVNNNFSVTAPVFTNWAGFYVQIYHLNKFIANAPKPAFLNENDRKNMLAQAYGMRAYIYFTLLKAYGDVILITEPMTSESLSNIASLRAPRSPKADVMTQIEADIAQSLQLYTEAGATNWRGKKSYWSKNATLALKGEAMLWKGEVLGAGTEAFTAAKEALASISGTLVAYDKLWGVENEGNAEFIFALDFQEDQATNGFSAYTARNGDVAKNYDQDGTLLSTYKFNGNNRYGASESLLTKLYANTNDQRGKTFVLIYTDAGVRDYTQFNTNAKFKGTILRKFMGTIGSDGNRKHVSNVPLYRYADVLLMLAEAKNQLGEDPSTEINQVRERAIGSGYTPYTNGSKIDNKRAILEERLLEFVGEGKRWWDLVRAGDGLLYEYVKTISASQAYKIYYPLSSAMLEADKENLKQTEGW